MENPKTRCSWVNLSNPLYIQYHDEEWGRPASSDLEHFEGISLEGAQAGLSWETVLKKRARYREVFKNFDPLAVSQMSDRELEEILLDPGIIRHRLKVFSVRNNAQRFLELISKYRSFDHYLDSMEATVQSSGNREESSGATRTRSALSDCISRDLKKRGFSFVGTTIIYAYLQAIGRVYDHEEQCFLFRSQH
ncbi:DNA-3-methyladenine glycosylase I [bacterium]|nr:DNA-3-methyladenine glycosylase I [bacterium]